MSYHKIAQIGASGNAGAPIHEALIKSGKFEITVVARSTSTFTSPHPSVKVVKVDFDNHQELSNALKGNEAVILSFGGLQNLDTNSKVIIEAAVSAGVRRVIPSEFGGDTHSPAGRNQIVFSRKVKIDDYLEEASKKNELEFTSIYLGPFFDWSTKEVQVFMGFDVDNKKVTLYNGGNNPINMTTLDTMGAAVVAVLSTPEKFKNKRLRISDFYVTQREILSILEAEIGAKFEVQEADADKLGEASEEALRKGDWSLPNLFGAMFATIFASNGSAGWGQPDDTASLGLPKKDLTTEIKKAF